MVALENKHNLSLDCSKKELFHVNIKYLYISSLKNKSTKLSKAMRSKCTSDYVPLSSFSTAAFSSPLIKIKLKFDKLKLKLKFDELK